MNIFFLSKDVKECAEMHNDKHTIKMILEYAQLLSTAHRVLDGTPNDIRSTTTGRKQVRYILPDSRNDLFYSATHINHPSAVWVRQSVSNYMWLSNLLVELCKEYTYRYGKVHKCERDGLVKYLHDVVPNNIPISTFKGELFTEPTPAMPEDCIIPLDSISSYRNYYNLNKTHLASWSGKVNPRNQPSWFIPNVRYK
jgi:hypothetical protein